MAVRVNFSNSLALIFHSLFWSFGLLVAAGFKPTTVSHLILSKMGLPQGQQRASLDFLILLARNLFSGTRKRKENSETFFQVRSSKADWGPRDAHQPARLPRSRVQKPVQSGA